jgi:hypothetical protein
MGTELVALPKPGNDSSLAERSSNAKLIIAERTDFQGAVRAADQLMSQFPNLKAAEPEKFMASIAAVLQQYPWGVVRECVDPRYGLARKVRFLSIADLVEWMDTRHMFYRMLAQIKPKAIEREVPEAERVKIGSLITDLVAALRAKMERPLISETLAKTIRDKGWAPNSARNERQEST